MPGKALVVDDSEADRTLIARLLEGKTGLEIDFAATADEALARLTAAAPEVVLTDLEMPGMDGLELISEVKARYPLVPVIVVTDQGSEEMAVRALKQGAASYVPKRILAQDLVPTVEAVLTAALHERRRSELMELMTRSESVFRLGNDRSLFGPLVSYLQDHMANLSLCDDAELTRVGVALEEALTNAAEHGNLELDSDLRDSDRAAYDELARERLDEPPYSDRRVRVEARLSRDEAIFVVRDEGRGFDPSNLPDPTDPANLLKASGRGVMLMRTFMDDVVYEEGGCCVTLIKRRTPAA